VFPHLFEPFFTTAAPGKGTGLGLALCHASLERMGGSIEARSGAQGATFALRLRSVSPRS
jgi:C4-dicarboxylate-specific signal transduction histidine kinase